MLAVNNNNLEIVKLLIYSGKVDINLRNYENQTALTIAVQNKSSEIIDLILNDKSFDSKKSNLDYAFFLSAKEITKQLLSLQDLNVNYVKNDVNLDIKVFLSNVYKTPLSSKKSSWGFRSSVWENIKSVECQSKPSPKTFGYSIGSIGIISPNGWGSSPCNTTIWGVISEGKKNYRISNYESSLIHAINNGDKEKVEIIINHQTFDPNKSQIFAAVFTAAANNHSNIFNVLLPLVNNDINLHYQNESLLVVAAKYNSSDIIKEIINNHDFDSMKSDINAAFGELLSNPSTILIGMLDFLLEHDTKHLINFSQLLPNGKSYFTALYSRSSPTVTFKYEHIQDDPQAVISYLLSHGADPNSPDGFGEYPLQYAIDSSDKLAERLIDSKEINLSQRIQFSDKNNDFESTVISTYLHFAVKKKSAIIKKIIEQNLIDINVTDSRGETPLMIAVRNKNEEEVKLLFENKDLDYLHINNKGEDAFNIASQNSKLNLKSKPHTKNEYLNSILDLLKRTKSSF